MSFSYFRRNIEDVIALTVSPGEINIASTAGETFEIFINSNTDWIVSCEDRWLKLSSDSGTGNGSIFITTLTANKLAHSRNTTLVFSATGGGSVIVKVTQLPDIATLINNTKETSLKIYPNPVVNNIVIEYSTDIYKTIKLINSRGIIIAKEKVTCPVQQIDFSKYEHGLYILEFVSAKGTERVKIIY
jgi:hypothetical protein